MALRSWQLLANYESIELVKRDYKAKHGLSPGTEHAREICAPFTQARHFFESASDADRSVKPLLLYYGVMALARGTTLYLTRGLRDAALAPSHGLSAKNWNSVFSQPSADVADLTIVAGARGAFPELLRSTANRSLLRSNSTAVTFKFKHAPVQANAEFRFGDLVGRLPELEATYSRWKQTSHCGRLSAQSVGGGKARITLRKGKYFDRAAADRMMGAQYFQVEDADAVYYLIDDDLTALPGLSDRANDVLEIGELYIVERYAGGEALCKIGAAFALSYLLGMLVRYHPSRWMSLLQGQSKDGSLPTLLAAVAFLEDRFPQLIVDFLEEVGPLEGRVP